MIVDAAERDHLEGARAHLERLLRAVAGGILGVDPEEEVHVDRSGELGRARETAHFGIVTEEELLKTELLLSCHFARDKGSRDWPVAPKFV